MAGESTSSAWVQDLGITILQDPHGGNAVADVVFIHGLQGHPRRTWRYKGKVTRNVPNANIEQDGKLGFLNSQKPKRKTVTNVESIFWPAEILPQHQSNVRIMTYGYDSHVSHFLSGPANKMTIAQHGRSFLNALSQRRLKCQRRPIILVAHSLGGLVAKEAIIESRKQKHHEFLQDIYLSTRAVIFFGTPHRGAGIAGWGLILSAIANAALIDTNAALLRDLDHSSGSAKLEELRRDFNDILDEGNIKVHTFQEAEGKLGVRAFSGKIVPDESSSFDSRRFEIVDSINANHMGMCRFRSCDDDGYQKFEAALTQYLVQIVLNPAVTRESEEDKEVQAEIRADLLERLKYGEIRTRQEQLRDIDIEDETIDWVWSSQTAFTEWLSSGRDIFWISGKAASGKSILTSCVARHDRTYQYLREHSSAKPWIIAQFFFDFHAGTGLANNFDGLLRSLLFQLLEKMDDVRLPGGKELPISEILDHQSRLRNLIIYLLREADWNLCLFIDGLDEYEGDVLDLLSYFRGLHEKFTNPDDSEKNVPAFKLCLASRPDPLISITLSKCPGFRMQDHNLEGMNRYVSLTLQRSLSAAREESYLLALMSRIAERAEGVFLWARFAIRDLLEGYAYGDNWQELNDRLEQVPKDLQDIYSRIFYRLKPEQMREASLMFALVGQAMRPLSLKELLTALNIAMGKPPERINPLNAGVIERRIASRSGGLLEVASQSGRSPSATSQVKLIHETVGRFLRTQDQQNLIDSTLTKCIGCVSKTVWLGVSCQYIQDLSHLYIPAQLPQILVGQQDVASYDSLSAPDRWPSQNTSNEPEDVEAFSFLQYTGLYIFDHARVAEESSSSYQNFRPLLSSTFLSIMHDRCYHPLCIWCADLRLWQQYVDDSVNASKKSWTVAVSHGLVSCLEDALAQKEVDPRHDDTILLFALAACFSAHRSPECAAGKNKNVISLLLEHGAEVTEKHFLLALRVAPPEILDLLLPKAAPEILSYHTHPLWSLMTQKYLGHDFEGAIDALLRSGNDIDSCCGDGGSALHAPILFWSHGYYREAERIASQRLRPILWTRSMVERQKLESYERGENHRLQRIEERCATLLKKGAGVNVRDSWGRTPLELTWRHANTPGIELFEHTDVLQPIMRILLQYRAVIDWMDEDDGTTPTREEILTYTRLSVRDIMEATASKDRRLKKLWQKVAADKERRWTNRVSGMVDGRQLVNFYARERFATSE